MAFGPFEKVNYSIYNWFTEWNHSVCFPFVKCDARLLRVVVHKPKATSLPFRTLALHSIAISKVQQIETNSNRKALLIQSHRVTYALCSFDRNKLQFINNSIDISIKFNWHAKKNLEYINACNENTNETENFNNANNSLAANWKKQKRAIQ